MKPDGNSKKALFVATVFKFLNFEKNDMKILKEMGYEIHTATNMEEAEWLRDDGSLDDLNLHKHQIDFGRTPLCNNTIKAYRQLKELLKDEDFEIMHCHTPVAAAIARFAARKHRKKGLKIVYTSHGFHFNKKSSIKSWLIYYPIEYMMAYYTDVIITINKEDYAVIQKFHVKEKRYIPGVGVDVNAISSMTVDRDEIRLKYNIPLDAFLILSIGELSARKNHEIIINAIAKLKRGDVYYIICGEGTKRDYLTNLIVKQGLDKRIFLIGTIEHEEVFKLCHSCDLGALPSKMEGLGLAGLETMAAGKPVVGSNVQGIKDYVIDNKTGITFSPNSVDEATNAIQIIYENKDLYKKLSINTLQVASNFDISIVDKKMRKIYACVLNDTSC